MKYFNIHLFISIILIIRFLELENYYLISYHPNKIFEFCETNLLLIKLDPIATRGWSNAWFLLYSRRWALRCLEELYLDHNGNG